MSHSLISQKSQQLVSHLSTRIVGMQQVVEELVITVLSQGHTLLTGAPGVAKTTLVRNMASSLGCGYKRIQFTPDLTPFDIIGGETIQFDNKNPDAKQVAFVPGPIFAPFILADEINRASPRTQSALLEAMQERQVTVAGETRKLPQPFYVFATQNPIESEGTFPLPDAQLDRFLLNIEIPYPEMDAEILVATQSAAVKDVDVLPDASFLLNAREVLEQIEIPRALLEGIVRLVRNTRADQSNLQMTKKYLALGASPRASQALVQASRAYALLRGETAVAPEHVFRMAPAVLRHRLILNFKALSEGLTANALIEQLLKETVF